MAGDNVDGVRIFIQPLIGGASGTVFELGDTVYLLGRFLDENGTAFTPSSTPTITIYNPKGVKVVDAVTMVARGIGRYSYEWQTNLSDYPGTVRVIVKAAISSGNTISNTERFYVAMVK